MFKIKMALARSNWLAAGCSGRPNGATMNRTESALGRRRRRCAGDGAPKARCTLAASAQCLHESRRRVNMDLYEYEDGRCARHATFNISAAGMDSMRTRGLTRPNRLGRSVYGPYPLFLVHQGCLLALTRYWLFIAINYYSINNKDKGGRGGKYIAYSNFILRNIVGGNKGGLGGGCIAQ